jgi:lipopolysaccharide assembly protein B
MWEPIEQWFLASTGEQVLLIASITFLIGFLAGGWRKRTKTREVNSTVDKGDTAFFKGIQYILSNDPNHAIEEFTKSVQVNSDTIETYVALGNLYRSKGDIERAIRIRQSLILRPNIDEKIKLRALFDLGLDYRKGGFLNRALDSFLEVIRKNPSDTETLKEIERIYEELKDWEKAYRTRQKLSRLQKGEHAHILAHHLVEMGKAFHQEGEYDKARSCYNKAVTTDRDCVDAYLHLGDLYFIRQDYKKAISTWKMVVEVAPQFTFLSYRRLEGAYTTMRNLKPVEDFLKECARINSDAFTHLALARYLYNEADVDGALRELESALELNPSFWEARKFRGEILLHDHRTEDALDSYKNLLEHLNVRYLIFQCSQCGFQPNDLLWQCPQCKNWDTTRLVDSTDLGLRPPPKSNSALPKPPEQIDEE